MREHTHIKLTWHGVSDEWFDKLEDIVFGIFGEDGLLMMRDGSATYEIVQHGPMTRSIDILLANPKLIAHEISMKTRTACEECDEP